MARALLFCALALLAVSGAFAQSVGTWTDLFGYPWTDVPLSIATAIACPNSSLCFLAGSNGNDPFRVYIAPTSQNFQNVTLSNNVGQSIMILSMAAEGLTGATAGFGLLKDPGILYTHDGYDWQAADDENLLAGQDIENIDASTYAFIGGNTQGLKNENGVLLSTNGGQNWKAFDWKNNVGLPSTCFARYGAFPSMTTWYVTAGSFPGENSTQPNIKSLAAKRHIDTKTGKYIRGRLSPNGTVLPHGIIGSEAAPNAAPPAPMGPANGYFAAMTKTSDGGQTWTVQYTNQGAFYFNDIHCASETVCIAVAEGFTDGIAPGARIFVTTDGETWNQKLIVNNVETSFMWVRMVSATEAWVGGSFAKSQFNTGAVFYHSTDAGETWTPVDDLKGQEEVLSMWFVSPTQGYATSITETDVTTILAYKA